jgi:chromosome condensin MukBEF ATPase and DNA-binding subunit MukB
VSQDGQSGLHIPTWLAASLTATLLAAVVAFVKLVTYSSQMNERQDEKLAQIEARQEIARDIVDRVDAQLATIRERLARLERSPAP